jgi:large subunit ribosomal protein L6
MSKLVKKPTELPKDVSITILGRKVDIKGPKGLISLNLNEGISVVVDGNTANVVAEEGISHPPFAGLEKARLNNAIIGVTVGYKKTLELVGVGYRAALKGNKLDLSLGFSHPCELLIPQGITVEVEKNTKIHISGIDKVQVGQFSATIRSKRPPEPYKGKGVKYEGEYIKRKAGKKAK